VPIAIVHDGRFVAVTPATGKTLSFSGPQEMVGMPVMSLVSLVHKNGSLNDLNDRKTERTILPNK
jgi:hypothetical protein